MSTPLGEESLTDRERAARFGLEYLVDPLPIKGERTTPSKRKMDKTLERAIKQRQKQGISHRVFPKAITVASVLGSPEEQDGDPVYGEDNIPHQRFVYEGQNLSINALWHPYSASHVSIAYKNEEVFLAKILQLGRQPLSRRQDHPGIQTYIPGAFETELDALYEEVIHIMYAEDMGKTPVRSPLKNQ